MLTDQEMIATEKAVCYTQSPREGGTPGTALAGEAPGGWPGTGSGRTDGKRHHCGLYGKEPAGQSRAVWDRLVRLTSQGHPPAVRNPAGAVQARWVVAETGKAG